MRRDEVIDGLWEYFIEDWTTKRDQRYVRKTPPRPTHVGPPSHTIHLMWERLRQCTHANASASEKKSNNRMIVILTVFLFVHVALKMMCVGISIVSIDMKLCFLCHFLLILTICLTQINIVYLFHENFLFLLIPVDVIIDLVMKFLCFFNAIYIRFDRE